MRYVFVSLAALLLFGACSKSSHSGGGGAIRIEGFKTTDVNGNFLGQVGPADHDWTFQAGLSVRELGLFNFDTGLSLDSTAMSAASNDGVDCFPNPAFNAQLYHIYALDRVVVKLVLIDSALKVAYRGAFKVKGSFFVQVDLSDLSKFPDHSSFRMYYSFSAKDHPDYKTGYGDIRICSSSAVGDCF
jgi:hypothetical protein